MFKNNK